MNKAYEDKTFIILAKGDIYDNCILLNKRKKFEEGHTHVVGYGTARWLIRLSRCEKIPRKISPYMLESLIRINTNKLYIKRLKYQRNLKLKEKERHNGQYH